MENDNLAPKGNRKLSVIFVGSIVVAFALLVFYFIYTALPKSGTLISRKPETTFQYDKFASDQEFKDFIQNQQTSNVNYFGAFGAPTAVRNLAGTGELSAPSDKLNTAPAAAPSTDRTSTTNVQVLGIDEPDIVKTDGKNIFYSGQNPIFYMGTTQEIMPSTVNDTSSGSGSSGSAKVGIITPNNVPSPIPPQYYGPSTQIINALPPESANVVSKLTDGGNLLLSDNTLMAFNGNKVTGYDVSNPSNPSKSWEHDLDTNSYLITSRLFNGTLYILSSVYLNQYTPCPIPLYTGPNALTVPCTNIYRPSINIPVDTTYFVSKINIKTGAIENTVSFVGSSSTSVVYMSPNAIYATFSINQNMFKFINTFLSEKATDLFPQNFLDNLKKLESYDISDQSKLNEFELNFSKYLSSIKDDERAKIENELANRMNGYMKDHQRDLEKSGIAKIGNDNLEVLSLNEVPGTPLNQFALDEYQGSLRIATTVNASSQFGNSQSVNDLYVLDGNLNQIGSIKDLGISERIYSVRFVEDKGYLVTFKQVDPFYVLDLSNPEAPSVAGQLKIPGYSSYLHPIDNNLILGVGQENQNTKISLFDVSNPTNPQEIDKYVLNEYWSEVQNNHHAFLLDSKHKVFFMPAGQSGYILSYENNKLSLKRVVANTNAKRAIYINDYLYVLGDSNLKVINENDWSDVKSLSF